MRIEDNTLVQQISRLSEEANKYQKLRERYEQSIKKLQEAQELINEAITTLDPVITIKRQERKTGPQVQEKIDEQYKKLQMGLGVNTESLQKDYPEETESNLNYLLYSKIAKIPGIGKRKPEGKKIEFYLK